MVGGGVMGEKEEECDGGNGDPARNSGSGGEA